MKRLLAVALVVGLLWAGVAPAGAQELNDYIDKQSGATYSGQQTVVCVTPDGRLTQVANLQQQAGVRVSEIEDGNLVVSQLGGAQSLPLASGYTVTPARPGTYLNRDVIRYNVLSEDETVRMALTFDEGSGALLESESFNSDGSLYCRNRLVTFQESVDGATFSQSFEIDPEGDPVDEITDEIDRRLPSQIATFERVAVFEWPDREILTGHYSDGLFSMTLFVSERSIEVPDLADKEPVELDSGTYQRAFDVGTVVYAWRTESGGYVLVGDLTLDLQEEVLALLPAPERLGFFGRLWRSIFGR